MIVDCELPYKDWTKNDLIDEINSLKEQLSYSLKIKKQLAESRNAVRVRMNLLEDCLCDLLLLQRWDINYISEVMEHHDIGQFVAFDDVRDAINSALKRPAEEKG